MRFCAAFAIAVLQVGVAVAGSGGETPPVAMADPAPGDHWAFEVRDEIIGSVRLTSEFAITEVTPKQIGGRVTIAGKPTAVAFDHLWNRLSDGAVHFEPNDGSGIQLPLVVGKTWDFKGHWGTANGNWSVAGTSKVAAHESVTTAAGTFETFRIETASVVRDQANPSTTMERRILTWYSPAIDHWVRRDTVSKVSGHLKDSIAMTLVSYGRTAPGAPASAGHPSSSPSKQGIEATSGESTAP